MSVYVRDIRRALAELIRKLELPDLDPKRVYTNRTRPLDQENLPAVCIFSLTEDGKPDGPQEQSPHVNQCECEIAIVVYVRTVAHDDSDEDDLLDDYSQVIRNLLLVNDRVDGNAESSRYVGEDLILNNEGEYAIGATQLRYRFSYRETMPDDAGGNLANLVLIHTTWDGAPKPDGTDDAHDKIELPQ